MRTRRSAGLLAVPLLVATALALAAAPAAGQAEDRPAPLVIVRITSASTAGTYTVGWQTLGSCDPGSDTSGMSGEVTLRVAARGTPDSTPEPGELTGTPSTAFVVTRPICAYVWHVSFVEATTDANCIVGPAPFAPDGRNAIRITLDDPATSCAQRSRIVVQLLPAVPVTVDDTDHNAILRTRFIATARRVEDAPRRCGTRTAVSKLDDNDTPDDTTDDSVSIELRVVGTTADGEECRYDVTLRVPRRLVATHGDHDHNIFEDVDPLATLSFTVGIASKTILLLQSVVGDAGGATARYELDRTCGKPEDSDIPGPLLPRAPETLIREIEPVILVELREGRFNITPALADDPAGRDAFDGVAVSVLDNEGETCNATVSVTHLPQRCVPDKAEITINLIRAPEPTVLEFEITCGGEVADSSGDGTGAGTDPDDEGDSGESETGDGGGGETGTGEQEGGEGAGNDRGTS